MDYYYLSTQDDVYGVFQPMCSPMCSPQNVCSDPGALVVGCVHCPNQIVPCHGLLICVGLTNHPV